MKISKAEFIKGVIGDDYSMRDDFSQIAFFGRSNVGKSSVINSLIGRRHLEKNISAIKEELPQILVFPYSAKTKEGKDELTKKIASFV